MVPAKIQVTQQSKSIYNLDRGALSPGTEFVAKLEEEKFSYSGRRLADLPFGE